MGFGTNVVLFVIGFAFVYFAVWQFHFIFVIIFAAFVGILFFAESTKVIYPIAGVVIAGLITLWAWISSFPLPLVG